MDYFLTEEQQMIVDVARQIANEKIIPQRAELDEKEEFATEILDELPRQIFLAFISPKNMADLGGGVLR